jgi:plasmid maintenance system antidote protein VapI
LFYNYVNIDSVGGSFFMARGSEKAPGAVIAASLKKLEADEEALAAAIGSTPSKVKEIIKGATISPELSVKLGKALGEKDKYFADLQLSIEIAAASKKVGKVSKLRKPAAGKPGRKPGVKAAASTTAAAKKPGRPGRKPGVKAAASTTAVAKKPGRPGRKPGVKAKV